jgi:RNA polymerase sigma factor (sigma-70 family)
MADIDHEEIRKLVARARRGDRDAFSEIVTLLMNPIVALTYRMTGDREAALDLAQDTFVSAWQNLRSFRGEARFETWLYRIASNKAINYTHRVQTAALNDVAAESVVDPASISPDETLSRDELAQAVLHFMQTLPPQQRIVFDLRFYKQLSFDEIAQVTGTAVGTVKTNYRLAVAKLREYASKKGLRP